MASIIIHLTLPSDRGIPSLVMRCMEAGYTVMQSTQHPLYMRSPTTSTVTVTFRIEKSMSLNDVNSFKSTLAAFLRDMAYSVVSYSVVTGGPSSEMVFLPAHVPEGETEEALALVHGTAYDKIGE